MSDILAILTAVARVLQHSVFTVAVVVANAAFYAWMFSRKRNLVFRSVRVTKRLRPFTPPSSAPAWDFALTVLTLPLVEPLQAVCLRKLSFENPAFCFVYRGFITLYVWCWVWARWIYWGWLCLFSFLAMYIRLHRPCVISYLWLHPA